jgi:TatD DNase family protein
LLVDTHCHLNFESFDRDREAVIERACQAGVTHMLNPGVDLPSSRAALGLAEIYPQVYAAVGIHPNDALTWDASTLSELLELTKHPKVVAIGEIGLDDYRQRAPRDIQERIFRQQLGLAAERGLPVVVHVRNAGPDDRRAMTDVLRILAEWQDQLRACLSNLAESPGVLHSFSGDLQAARRAMAYNFLIGISGPVTFRKAEETRQVVADHRLENLLVETDAPFLTPHPHRGERNEPAHVKYVVEKIAQIKDQTLERVADITTANAERLFRWQAIH